MRRRHLLSILEIGSGNGQEDGNLLKGPPHTASEQAFVRQTGDRREEAEDAQPLSTHCTNSLKAVLLTHSDSVLFNQGSRRSFSHKASRCNFL